MNTQIRNSRGSALAGVLAVLFILLTVFFAVFGSAISRSALLKKKINLTKAGYLADAGLNHFLGILNQDSLNWKKAIDYEFTETISGHEKFSVRSTLSGGYIMASSTGIAGGRKVTKKALIGLLPWKDLNSAIINGDPNYPLVVAGKTEIKGDVIVGPESVVKGSIEGEVSQNEELIKGRIMSRPKVVLPQINKEIIEVYLSKIADKTADPTEFITGSTILSKIKLDKNQNMTNIIVEDNLEINSLRLNSEVSEVTICARGNITLRGDNRIEGPIEIISKGSIIVGDNTYIDGATLIAEDSIIFKDGSLFKGQAISGRKLKVSGNALVDYPSFLYVYAPESADSSILYFEAGTKSKTVALIDGVNQKNYNAYSIMQIDTNSSVSGFVYGAQHSDIRGTLYGISMTESYSYYRIPTTYINWLKDAIIDRSRLDFLPILPIVLPNINGYAIFRTFEESR